MKLICTECTLLRPGHDGICDECRGNMPIKWHPGEKVTGAFPVDLQISLRALNIAIGGPDVGNLPEPLSETQSEIAYVLEDGVWREMQGWGWR